MPTMTKLERVLIIFLAIPLFAGFAWAGTIICNYVLIEFLGPNAPQPSVLGWTGFWAIAFIISNLHLDFDWERISDKLTRSNAKSG